MEIDKRPSWDEYFAEIVNVAKTRSPCDRLKVGCIIVNNNRIISQGYNGFLPGCPHKSIVKRDEHGIEHEQAIVHAEQNAITDCAKRGVKCENSTAYITHYPCLNCCKILIAAGIDKIYYLNNYKNDNLVKEFCKQADVQLTHLILT